MKDPCITCDKIEKRNSFLREHQDHLLEILKDSTGKPLFKQVESGSKLGEGRLRLLADATFEGICIHDQGMTIDANHQFADMFGYTVDEIKGMHCSNMIAPQSLEAVMEYISTGFLGLYEVYGKRKDGSIFPVEVRAREFQQDGKVLRFAVFRDLTKHKEMERQIAESEKCYRELYNNSPIALYRTRISNGELLECNHALAELFGYDSKEEFQAASTAADRYVDINDRAVLLEKLKKGKRIESFQTQNKRKDGELVWIQATAEIFPEQGYIEGAMRDVTATKVLSKTEKLVLDQLMQGKGNKQIAKELDRSVRTIEDHRSHIMRKLEVDNLIDLTQKVLKLSNHHEEE